MNCENVREITADYVSDCLPRDVRRVYEDHIAVCAACAAELKNVEEMIESLGRLGERCSPVDCWPAIRDRLAREPRRNWLARYLFRPAFLAPVFAVVVLLVAVITGQFSTPPQGSPASIPGYNRYVSAHARVQRAQAFSDPDVTFVAAELENASFGGSTARP